MSRIEWRDEFATGIRSVDHEHRELVELLNQIVDKLESDEDRELICGFLGEVLARISAHFALEEQVMREHSYDQYDDHKADHERLLDDIRDIMDAYEDGGYAGKQEEFAERLKAWFVLHFKTRDARLHKRLGV